MGATKLSAERDTKHGKAPAHKIRSHKWATVRKHWLTQHPTCSVCNSTQQLNVHHILPFHTHPELELDPNNLITLCENYKYGINCHLLVGHLGDYKNINPDVLSDAEIWKQKLNKNSKNVKGN